jgi:hypothetical protein
MSAYPGITATVEARFAAVRRYREAVDAVFAERAARPRGLYIRELIVDARAAGVDRLDAGVAYHAADEWGASYRRWAAEARMKLAASERRYGIKARPMFDPDIAREMRAEVRI